MLRKLITVAITAVLAKQAWDRMRATPVSPVVTPAQAPGDVESESVQAQPIAPESPLQYH